MLLSDKNFMQIAHHLSELWKKKQKGFFMKHRVYVARKHFSLANQIKFTIEAG